MSKSKKKKSNKKTAVPPLDPMQACAASWSKYKAIGPLKNNKHAEYQAEGSPNYR